MPKVAPSLGRNPQTEQHLSDRGFEWEFRSLPLGEIDEDRSLHNQARIGKPVDSGTVSRYATAMGQGSVFPAIIVASIAGSNRLQIVDGNHRFQSAKAVGSPTIDAYVILGGKPSAVTLLTFEANTRHGVPSSLEDQLHQGLWMIDNGISAEEAARRLGGVKAAQLRAAAKEAENALRAEDSGIPRAKWDRLPRAIQSRLGQLVTNDSFGPMTQLTIDAGLGGSDVAKAVTELNQLRSHKQQQEYIAGLRLTFAEELQVGGTNLGGSPGKGQRTRSARTALGMALGQIDALPGVPAILDRMTADETTEWRVRLKRAKGRLEEIERALSGVTS